jgi:hypothetical protein
VKRIEINENTLETMNNNIATRHRSSSRVLFCIPDALTRLKIKKHIPSRFEEVVRM